MKTITIAHATGKDRPREFDITQWREWTIDEGRFIRHYSSDEICYILEGEALIAAGEGSSLEIREGDFVSVSSGTSCTWAIRKKVRALYKPCQLYNTFI
jgi:uncharacterized cupin superfamily protein